MTTRPEHVAILAAAEKRSRDASEAFWRAIRDGRANAGALLALANAENESLRRVRDQIDEAEAFGRRATAVLL